METIEAIHPTSAQEDSIPSNLLCKLTYLREFLCIESPSTMSKILKKALAPKEGQDVDLIKRGRERYLTPEQARKVLEHRGYNLNLPAKVISYWVNKGGVGKSSCSKMQAMFLATLGFKVLYIDGDSQGNATDTFNLEDKGIAIDEETAVLADVLEGVPFEDCIIKIDKNLHLMPSTLNNQGITDQSISKYEKHYAKLLDKLLSGVKENYDYILIDCAPNLGLLNMCFSLGSDMTVVLAHPHKFSKKGVQVTFEHMDELEDSFDKVIPRKVLFNRYAKKNNITHKVLSEIMADYGEDLLPIIIGEKQEVAHAIEYDHNFFIDTKFREMGSDGKMKTIEYKESPNEFAKLTYSMLDLPELTLKQEKQLH